GYAGQHVEDGQITTLGLYQGEKIGQSAKAAYHKALVSYFSTFIETALINELQENEQHREYLYETLKTYLMLFNDDKLDTEHVLNWFTYYYERTYPGALNEELRTDLALHTQNFVKQTERGLYLNN